LSNVSTNRGKVILRQYFPKGNDLAKHTRDELDAVAAALNSRPRKTLDGRHLRGHDDCLRSLKYGNVATTPLNPACTRDALGDEPAAVRFLRFVASPKEGHCFHACGLSFALMHLAMGSTRLCSVSRNEQNAPMTTATSFLDMA